MPPQMHKVEIGSLAKPFIRSKEPCCYSPSAPGRVSARPRRRLLRFNLSCILTDLFRPMLNGARYDGQGETLATWRMLERCTDRNIASILGMGYPTNEQTVASSDYDHSCQAI